MRAATKQLLKRAFPTVFFRHPRTTLEPERLYAFLDAIWTQRDVEGSVVEVGCYLGGTAALGSRMMENLGISKRYVVIDTFTGFVPDQFERDVARGVSERRRDDFRADEQTVRRLLRFWGAPDVEVVKADVATLDENDLPDTISLALVDVDLEVPTYEGLRRVMSRLSPSGLVLVDDCNERSEWTGAKRGYQRFVHDHGLPEEYHFGMGVARIQPLLSPRDRRPRTLIAAPAEPR
jgi:O-methyltransferase